MFTKKFVSLLPLMALLIQNSLSMPIGDDETKREPDTYIPQYHSTCPKPEVTTCDIFPVQETYYPGSYATYFCPTVSPVPVVMRCIYGTWIPTWILDAYYAPRPQQTTPNKQNKDPAEHCMRPAAPHDSSIVAPVTKKRWRRGEKVIYKCKEGLYVAGPQSQTCGKNGRWEGEKPSCVNKDFFFVFEPIDEI